MPVGLSQLARSLITNRAQTLAAISAPLLVWEVPSGPNPEAAWVHTEAGHQASRPRAGEPLVFNVEKVAGRKNAFSMGVTIGRVDTNDIQIDEGSVSRFHAFFQHDPKLAAWFVSDADSKNGTYVDGIRLEKNEKVRLRDGAAVRFGDTAMRFVYAGSIGTFIDEIVERGRSR